jgi:F0F1-type ATP synthase delta subunit
MKYQAHIYAKALVEVLGDTAKAGPRDDALVAKNFLELVSRNGDAGHLKKILEEASRFARARSGVRKVTIESARALSATQTEAMKRFMKEGDVVERRIDPNLIAGVKITLNEELQFDGSLKNKLNRVLGSV